MPALDFSGQVNGQTIQSPGSYLFYAPRGSELEVRVTLRNISGMDLDYAYVSSEPDADNKDDRFVVFRHPLREGDEVSGTGRYQMPASNGQERTIQLEVEAFVCSQGDSQCDSVHFEIVRIRAIAGEPPPPGNGDDDEDGNGEQSPQGNVLIPLSLGALLLILAAREEKRKV
jgi:hypothetical protein